MIVLYGRSAAAAFDKKLKDRLKTLKNPGGLNFSELAALYLTAKISTMSTIDQDNTYTKRQRIINPRIGHVPAAKKRAGITRDLRPDSLRHKVISDMLAAGGDVGAVAELVGHADPQMALKVYQQINTVIKRAAIDGLGNTQTLKTGDKKVDRC